MKKGLEIRTGGVYNIKIIKLYYFMSAGVWR